MTTEAKEKLFKGPYYARNKQDDNKDVVGAWFTHFWGKTCNLQIVDEIAAPDMLLKYSLHEPRRGRADIKAFMTDVRNAFPDLKRALQRISTGTTVCYAEIARRIGSPKSVRAVAGACAANNIAVAIPCHRVVRTDGSLSGYAWGLDRKRQLIDRESEQPAKLKRAS
jgi:O-6-methylguanine DNA methyltransferase